MILATGHADLPAGEAPKVPRRDKPCGCDALADVLTARVRGAA